MTDMQRAFEAYDDALDSLWKLVGGNDHPIYMQFLSFRDSLALRAAPEGWSFQRQDDGSIIVAAESYGVVHVRPDDSDSIAAAMLHLLANDLAARAQEANDA